MNVKYTLTAEPEPESVRGNFDSGDDEKDREIEESIIKALNSGNELAWCCACVTAEVELDGERFTGKAYLGACSYADWKQFEHAMMNEYDMKADALESLKLDIAYAVKRGEAAKTLAGKL